MSKVESSFRTALVGGFNRQDVMDYIGTSSRVAQERIAKLESQSKVSQDALTKAQKEAREATAKLASMEQEFQEMKQELDQARQTLQEQESTATAVQAQLERLEEETAKMEKGAAAYAQLKDRTATIELEAHQRAKAIEEEALERAKKACTSAEQMLFKAQTGYSRLRSDLEKTVANATQELGRMDQTLESVKTEFVAHDQALSDILRTYRSDQDTTQEEG